MKTERNLLKLLSDDECRTAFAESVKTYEMHKKSAESISKNGSYGAAITHLILGTEELVKAILLYFQSLGVNLRNVSDIYLFFTDHIIKHQLATMISAMYRPLKLFMGVVYKKHEELHHPENKVEYTPVEKAFLSKDEKRLQATFRDLPEMLDWWDEANDMKNDGLYVNYKNGLKTPMQIEEKEYLRALEITSQFKNEFDGIISYFEKLTDSEKAQVAKITNKKKFFDTLVKMIESRKKQRRK